MKSTVVERRWVRAALLLAVAANAACRDSVRPELPAPGDLARAEVQGGGQTGGVDAPLADSIVVRLTTRRGGPARDVTLEWRVLGTAGGATRFPTTRTDEEGRSANVWTLGRKSGEQSLEIRAVLPEGVVVLDTVRAMARPGPVAALTFEGDTSRMVAVGDTARLALRATDRFGNLVDAAAADTRWSSSDASVAVVDSAGKVRASSFGAATVEARAGSASARVRLRVNARVEAFSVAVPGSLQSGIADITGNAARVVAIGSGGENNHLLSLGSAGWAVQSIGSRRPNSIHVTPVGLAVAGTDSDAYISGRNGAWTGFASIPPQSIVAGAGEKVFARKDDWSVHVYRLDGEQIVDLLLPSRYGRGVFGLFAVESPTDVYVGVDSAYRHLLLHWDGGAWERVLTPGDTTPLYVSRLRGTPTGGVVWAWSDHSSVMYRIRRGVAERVELPAGVEATFNTPVAISETGQPHLLLPDRIVYRTAAGWKTIPIPGDWTPTALWPAAEGVIWVGAKRATGVSSAGQVTWEVAFLRITTTG